MRLAFRSKVTPAFSRGRRPTLAANQGRHPELQNQRHTQTLINFYVNYPSGMIARRTRRDLAPRSQNLRLISFAILTMGSISPLLRGTCKFSSAA